MRTTKSFFGLVMALVPVLWFGGLALYFNHVRNLGGGLFDGALGPTIVGLGALGLLFLVLFLWRLRRTAAPPAPPKSGLGPMDAALEETKSDFDPDAAIARYLARRSAGGPGAGSTSEGDGPVRPGSFGRKGA